MTDDPYDKLLDATAADYNRPGAVPREEMWAKIRAARTAAATAPSVATAKARRVWVLPGIGIAALLILSLGILIGRGLGTADSARLANASRPPSRADTVRSSAAPTPSRGIDTVSRERDVAFAAVSASSRATDSAPRSTALPRSAGDAEADAVAYRLVVLQHLAGTEAAITAFRSAARRAGRASCSAPRACCAPRRSRPTRSCGVSSPISISFSTRSPFTPSAVPRARTSST